MEVGAELGAIPDTRTTALVKDKYAIAVKNGEQTVEHIPMFLSKLTFYFWDMMERFRSKWMDQEGTQ